MSIGSRIKERRESLGYSQTELAEMLGVTKGAIGNYETDQNSPRASTLYKVFDILKCDANYLFQDEIRNGNINFSSSEMNAIRKYRSLDEYGKKAVDAVLDIENERNLKPDPQREQKETIKTKIIPLLGNSFAAGNGEPDFGNMWEDYEVPINSPAEFAVRINGDSMEPYLPDGSIAFGVKKPPEDGDVAALMLDGEFFCKQVCQDSEGNIYLFSLNRKRKDADVTIWRDMERRLYGFGTIIMAKRVPLPND